jgi:hypothetical protein
MGRVDIVVHPWLRPGEWLQDPDCFRVFVAEDVYKGILAWLPFQRFLTWLGGD